MQGIFSADTIGSRKRKEGPGEASPDQVRAETVQRSSEVDLPLTLGAMGVDYQRVRADIDAIFFEPAAAAVDEIYSNAGLNNAFENQPQQRQVSAGAAVAAAEVQRPEIV